MKANDDGAARAQDLVTADDAMLSAQGRAYAAAVVWRDLIGVIPGAKEACRECLRAVAALRVATRRMNAVCAPAWDAVYSDLPF